MSVAYISNRGIFNSSPHPPISPPISKAEAEAEGEEAKIRGKSMLMSLSRKEGFSLVELLITVALIGIVGAIAIPSIMQQLPKFNMRGASRDITAKLMMARLRAIQENKEYGVTFTVGAIDRFSVVTGAGWTTVVGEGEGAANINVTVEGCLGNRIEFKTNGTVSAANNGNITTCPDGGSGYERIIIVSTLSGTLLTQNIVINPYTGNVAVQ